MEQGKVYKVIYKDDGRARSKDLEFLGKDEDFLRFWNRQTRKEEFLPIQSIVRIEGDDKDEGQQDLQA